MKFDPINLQLKNDEPKRLANLKLQFVKAELLCCDAFNLLEVKSHSINWQF